MIGPVSSTGRTMMTSLQQAMQKGMPPDQAIQYVKSMATQGVAPLADLYAMMNQFQRLKQQKVTPPQTPPTIKDQLDALDQQQQMPQQGGIAQLQAPPPAGQPMDRGLGAIDAGLMQYPKFAGGGVVALAGGGDPEDEEPSFFSKAAAGLIGMMGDTGATDPFMRGPERRLGDLGKALANVPDEDLASQLEKAVMTGDQKAATDLSVVLRQRNRKDLVDRVTTSAKGAAKTQAAEARAAQLGFGKPPPAAPVPPPPAPVAERRPAVMGGPAVAAPPAEKDITDEQYQKLQAFRKREGLGAAREEMRQFLTSEEKRLDKAYGEDKRLAFADIGFKMAAAASRPGATFLGALAEGAMSGTQAMRGINKELAENKRLLKQSMIKLREADELEKEGDYKAAMGLNREARAEALKLYELRENLKMDREKIAAQREATAATRDYTMATQRENQDVRRRTLAQGILDEDMQYQSLRSQLAALRKDPEDNADKIAAVQSQIAEIKRQAQIDAGLMPEDVTAASDAIAELQRLASARGLNLVPTR